MTYFTFTQAFIHICKIIKTQCLNKYCYSYIGHLAFCARECMYACVHVSICVCMYAYHINTNVIQTVTCTLLTSSPSFTNIKHELSAKQRCNF